MADRQSAYSVRLVVFVRQSDRAAARALAASLDPDNGGGGTFAAPLSLSGGLPVQAWGACIRVTPGMRAALESLATQFPTARAVNATANGWSEQEAFSRACELVGLSPVAVPE